MVTAANPTLAMPAGSEIRVPSASMLNSIPLFTKKLPLHINLLPWGAITSQALSAGRGQPPPLPYLFPAHTFDHFRSSSRQTPLSRVSYEPGLKIDDWQNGQEQTSQHLVHYSRLMSVYA